MIYAISDIHGCYKTLQKLLNKLDGISTDNTYFFLGDYIDRGPDSKSVLDFLIDFRQQNNSAFILRGNHEQMMMDTFKKNSKENCFLWEQNGCRTTLKNFGVPTGDYNLVKYIPLKYIEFIEKELEVPITMISNGPEREAIIKKC